MERAARIDAKELTKRMQERFEVAMAQVTQAVNAAPDGHWIDASEEACRAALGEFKRDACQMALQMRIEAAETNAAFSPGGQGRPRSGG